MSKSWNRRKRIKGERRDDEPGGNVSMLGRKVIPLTMLLFGFCSFVFTKLVLKIQAHTRRVGSTASVVNKPVPFAIQSVPFVPLCFPLSKCC